MSELIERARTFLVNSNNELAKQLVQDLLAEIKRLDDARRDAEDIAYQVRARGGE